MDRVCEELIALIKQVEAEQESQYVAEELGEWAEDMEVLEVRRKEGSGSKCLLTATKDQGLRWSRGVRHGERSLNGTCLWVRAQVVVGVYCRV